MSWSKKLVRKLFHRKSKPQDSHADDGVGESETGQASRYSFSGEALFTAKKSKTDRPSKRFSDRVSRGKFNQDPPQLIDILEYRIFVATWNVGGKSPPSNLNIDDWLHTSPPADIYVLGFQEIVPLNAGNVLGTENNGPARKWISLIGRTLNNIPGADGGFNEISSASSPVVELDADFDGSRHKASSFFYRRSFHSLSHSFRMDGGTLFPQYNSDRRYSVCDQLIYGSRPSDSDPSYRWVGSFDDETTAEASSPSIITHMSCGGSTSYMDERDRSLKHSRYHLIASKQMVGIFLTVWVRGEIKEDVKNIKVSSVGRGLMGYLGNKGSISISMAFHQTTFCFVCCHLTSGQKEGDELRRNFDVVEILKKTRFPRVPGVGDRKSPETILDHDRIIWLGDLNYRIALSYRTAKALVEMHNWRALLENDQLRIERRRGRVFKGWYEGRIYFAPTYKYSHNSDRYAGEDMNLKEKRRTPAWCDRILWYGRGLNQLSYVRGESRFSDHRPVCSLFTATVESTSHTQSRRRSLSISSSRIQVEELLPHPQRYTEGHSQRYTELSFF